jgi:hypothetical protein
MGHRTASWGYEDCIRQYISDDLMVMELAIKLTLTESRGVLFCRAYGRRV